jgi:hypothetical protein
MRRSLAPSTKTNILPNTGDDCVIKPGKPMICAPKKKTQDGGGKDSEITITRIPMFGFLEVPDSLRKQFKVPSGCKITEK